MTIETWQLDENSETIGGRDELGFKQKRLTTARSAGVSVVTIHVGELQVDVIPTRGMGIHCVRRDNIRFGWDSPINGPVHPQWVPVFEPSGLGWLEGFDEMLVRCGLLSNGAPQYSDTGMLEYPLHGRIANLPAVEVFVEIDSSSGQLRLTGSVYETRFHFCRLKMTTTYSLDLQKPDRLSIQDRVENLSDRNAEIQMLYHTNIGRPILEEGAQIVAPVKMICPRNEYSAQGLSVWDSYAAPSADFSEQVYFMQLHGDASDQTTVLLHDRNKDSGFSIDFNVNELPCFSLWKNTVGEMDGYVTGLEPGVNFPNTRRFEKEHGRVVELAPHAAAEFNLIYGFHRSAVEVQTVLERIGEIRTDEVEIFKKPQVDLCEMG